MSAPKIHALLGASDLKLSSKTLSILSFMCSPDKPVDAANTMGDIAFSEICISDVESADISVFLDTLRSPGQTRYVSKLVAAIRQEGQQTRNRALVTAADAIESENARILKVFFLRARAYQVIRVSTDEVIGRIVAFPDQISDDYGNNMEVRTEKGIYNTKVNCAHDAAFLPTVYVGHGQGSAMAQICGFATGQPAIILDGNVLSDVLVQNAVAHKCVKGEAPSVERDWNVIHYQTEACEKRYGATDVKVVEVAKQILAEEKAAEAKAAEKAKKENGGAKANEKPEDEGYPAEKYFGVQEWQKVTGVISSAATSRFERTGRYPSSVLSDMFVNYTTIIRPSAAPY